MTYRRMLAAALLVSITFALGAAPRASGQEPAAFLVEPYLQLGDGGVPTPNRPEQRLALLWHAEDADADWSVSYRIGESETWTSDEPTSRRVAVATIAPHRVYRATLSGAPGATVAYRVARGPRVVFEATTKLPPSTSASGTSRAVVYGDCGSGTPEQRAIAHGVYQARPDYCVITGDIVYSRGRISEYREKFYPVYNAAKPSPEVGAPLLRSTLFVAAPGNHDIATRDLGKYPDGLAYFLYWDQPRNGPDFPNGPGGSPDPAAMDTPPARLVGPDEARKNFLDAAGPTFPSMANFSFDYGRAHWLVLDANAYVDWSSPKLRDWIARDLSAVQDGKWRFVAFHHPGFNSSKAHFDEQRTRQLAPLFEQCGVSLVFAGHVHNYQRSYPMRFAPKGGPEANGRVAGEWTLDTKYDGLAATRPDGVIYVVTGAGGAKLYNPEQQDDPATWQPFTRKFVSKIHSFTIVDVEDSRLTLRQLSADERELDRFVVTR